MTATRKDGLRGQPNLIELRGPMSPGLAYRIGTSQPGNAEPPHNSQLHIGWNTDAEGSASDNTEPVFRATWGANHQDAESNRLMRFRLVYRTGDGLIEQAPLSCDVNRSSHVMHLGFFDAPAVPRPTVSGSWSDGSAGASLTAALERLGLIADETVP